MPARAQSGYQHPAAQLRQVHVNLALAPADRRALLVVTVRAEIGPAPGLGLAVGEEAELVGLAAAQIAVLRRPGEQGRGLESAFEVRMVHQFLEQHRIRGVEGLRVWQGHT